MPISPSLLINVQGNDECWLYTGKLNSAGYGPHRKVYINTFGPIPSHLVVMHKCNTRACCNPRHLMLGTQKENLKQAIHEKRFNQTGRSLTCRKSLQGTGLYFDKRSNTYYVVIRALGRKIYLGSYKDQALAATLASAAREEVDKLLRRIPNATFDHIQEFFHASAGS